MPSATCLHADAWSRGDIISLIALIVSGVAFLLALYTLHRGNLNSSAASMIPLHTEIRERWEEYLASFSFRASGLTDGSDVNWATIEEHVAGKLERLMNVLEIAAAVEVEGTLSGVSGILMRDYLRRMLDTIISDRYTNEQVSRLLQDDTTFLFIRRFIGEKEELTSVLPKDWYAYPKVSLLDRARSKFRY